ncbi:MAG: hypothetical protein ABI878_06150 [Acidobacteriota bacterium]
MTKRYFNIAALSTLMLVLATASFGQFTITIPKIPKIKKPTTDTQNQNQNNTNNNNNNSNNNDQQNTSNNNNNQTSNAKSGGCDQYSFVYGVFVDDIKKKQEEASSYTGPQDKIYYVAETQDDYIRLAVSKSRRDKWFADKKMTEYRQDTACNKLDPALDDLAAAVAKTIHLYVPEAGKFAARNPAEEALMKKQVTDLGNDKIFKIGLASANWNIGKDDYNFPINRYKYGMIYLKPTGTDDPYCRMIFVNVIQDYAGGGTYGATYGRFIKSEIAGCPAGQ